MEKTSCFPGGLSQFITLPAINTSNGPNFSCECGRLCLLAIAAKSFISPRQHPLSGNLRVSTPLSGEGKRKGKLQTRRAVCRHPARSAGTCLGRRAPASRMRRASPRLAFSKLEKAKQSHKVSFFPTNNKNKLQQKQETPTGWPKHVKQAQPPKKSNSENKCKTTAPWLLFGTAPSSNPAGKRTPSTQPRREGRDRCGGQGVGRLAAERDWQGDAAPALCWHKEGSRAKIRSDALRYLG